MSGRYGRGWTAASRTSPDPATSRRRAPERVGASSASTRLTGRAPNRLSAGRAYPDRGPRRLDRVLRVRPEQCPGVGDGAVGERHERRGGLQLRVGEGGVPDLAGLLPRIAAERGGGEV